mmetsp:Transcript_10393/g.13568  ORF Transcript_10393/g.13568 Transcript_10393/m.13568 type:complete len:170 (-) Transcript_10393:48-557(-)
MIAHTSTKIGARQLILLLCLFVSQTLALSPIRPPSKSQTCSSNHNGNSAVVRRKLLGTAALALVGGVIGPPLLPPPPVFAAEDGQALTDEEMAARIARKLELQKGTYLKNREVSSTEIRSDVNPQAAVNLRSRSTVDNAKIALEKQQELKKRDKMQKRDDLCEMLGRGC